MSDASKLASAPAPRWLRIRFAAGERPHLFWVGCAKDEKRIYKVLSKRDAEQRIFVLVVEETGQVRRTLAYRGLPQSTPSGWLSHWVATLEQELGVAFRCYDLRHVHSREAWLRAASTLGWLRELGDA